MENIITFRSPVANTVDYTVLAGSPDEIIAAYRQVTGLASRTPRRDPLIKIFKGKVAGFCFLC